MRTAIIIVALLSVGSTALAADPIYLDQMMEMPLVTLQQQFPRLRGEGCYQIGPDRFLQIEIAKKDRKPSRIVIASAPPCRKADEGPALDVRERIGVELGDSTRDILEKMGRPDASAPPDAAFKKLGETEYFYICRITPGCSRHTSVFMRDGIVSAISTWYSD
ncbi:MAG: hypothetical protein ABI779_12750 [Acidobacteriota bacterium]